MSSNPSLVGKISGEALTTRFQATLDLLFQLGVGDLKSVDLCFAEREQKASSVKTSDFRGSPLREDSLRIPLDRRRSVVPILELSLVSWECPVSIS
jgi:hypothetical protein